MRRILMMTMAGAALTGAFLAQVGPAQQTQPKASPKEAAKAPAKAPAAKGKSTPIPPGDWPMYSRDLTSSRYSPLKQITTANVSKMAKVWSYRPARQSSGGAGCRHREGNLGAQDQP
jgi:glucose dehydrogenase